jgi:hypothetical protein
MDKSLATNGTGSKSNGSDIGGSIPWVKNQPPMLRKTAPKVKPFQCLEDFCHKRAQGMHKVPNVGKPMIGKIFTAAELVA